MGQLRKLDKVTEYQLTGAIQKAASISIGSDRDRSQILVQQLDLANIPKELTKTAARAFNRRLAVVTLGKRSDQTKAQDFPLADVQKVASLRGVREVTKQASVNTAPFVFNVSNVQMKKAASVLVPQQKEPTVEHFMRKLQSLVDKCISTYESDHVKLCSQQAQLQKMVKKSSQMLNQDIRSANLLATVYGDTYSEIFKGKVQQNALKKSAAYAVLPANATVEYVQKTIRQHDSVRIRKEAFLMKQAAVKMIVDDAAKIQETVKERMLKGIVKRADGYSVLKDIAANALSIPLVSSIKGAQGLTNISQQAVRNASKLLSQQYAVKPESAITSELLNADKYDDKYMRLVDTLADKDFASYTAQEIQKAVQDVLTQRPQYLSPRFKQHLKTAVNTRLMQGGKTNQAAQAAAATTAKVIIGADSERKAQQAAQLVKAISPSATQGTTLADILPGVSNTIGKIDLAGGLGAPDLAKSWAEYSKTFADKRRAYQTAKQQAAQQRLQKVKNYLENRERALQNVSLSAVKNTSLGRQLGLTNKQRKALKGLHQLSIGQRTQAMQTGQRDLDTMTPEQVAAAVGGK